MGMGWGENGKEGAGRKEAGDAGGQGPLLRGLGRLAKERGLHSRGNCLVGCICNLWPMSLNPQSSELSAGVSEAL